MREIRETAGTDLSSFVEARVDRVFTELSLQHNYFWRVYINGRYSPDCCPDYLREENFERLRTLWNRIHPHTMSLTDFLRFSGDGFSIYVLLDHMDWLVVRVPVAGRVEGDSGYGAARARIIYRSGGTSFNHVPEFAKSGWCFRQDIASALHREDRVGTYGSFYLASVQA